MLKIIISSMLVLSVLTIETWAQGMCVPPEFKVKTVQGKIIGTSSKGEEPIEGILVELRKKDDLGPITAKLTTGEDGHFKFTNIRPGRYVVVATHPLFVSFIYRLIVNKHLKKEISKQEIVIDLGVDNYKACGGGFAELREKQP